LRKKNKKHTKNKEKRVAGKFILKVENSNHPTNKVEETFEKRKTKNIFKRKLIID